ncbi:MAG TPA: non-ribosomal peptide synthetase [Methylomusa anaerophila]|uniref:Polyketide synthase PksN n=1 Tax=Methylomusa anaerophila TaxID=1930071 RepID=A0A348AN88_9FIRM|nr:non-ribosomal peptide synthetase [Methylomusa anaerophila]BBB92536.1 polyketide synthase PksN [Methylomusa anaerophila]HML87609.1 non-ribosomal peptide synthetase [Methylomusa anaerophila]
MASNKKFSCYIIGDGALIIACGRRIIDSGHDICGIITANSKVRNWAGDKSIPCFGYDNYLNLIKQKAFDYLFSIVNYDVIPEEILALPRKMAINFHDSLLPAYAGIHATSWALINKEIKHGVTWHEMVTGIDMGRILKQEIVEIETDETAFSLNLKCYEASLKAFGKLIAELATDSYSSSLQDINQRTYFSKNKRPSVGCVLSWKSSAEDMSALVRALDFKQYRNKIGLAKLAVKDEYIIIDKLCVTGIKSSHTPGTIVEITDSLVRIATVNNDIEVNSFRTIDGEKLSICDFIKQYNISVKDCLVEIDADKGARISKLYNSICRFEDFWVNQLSCTPPNSCPGIVQNGAPKPIDNYLSVEVPVIQEFINYGKNNGSIFTCSLAAIGVFLCMLNETTRINMSIGYKELKKELKGLENLFAVNVPMQLDFDCILTFKEACAHVGEKLDTAKQNKTFIRDLIVRYPELKSKSVGYKNKMPVVVEHVSSIKNYSHAEGSYLSIGISNNVNTWKIVFDEGILNEEKVLILSKAMAEFLKKIVTMPEITLGQIAAFVYEIKKQLVYDGSETMAEEENREDFISDKDEAHSLYWKQQLAGSLSVLELPTDRPRAFATSFTQQVSKSVISPEISERVKFFAQNQRIKIPAFFLGIFKLLLYRYTGQEDIIIGMQTEHIHESLGILNNNSINMIAIRSNVVGTQQFLDYIHKLQQTFNNGLKHAAYPFELLVRELNISAAEVFQVAFAYQNYNDTEMQHHYKYATEFTQDKSQNCNYELKLEISEKEDSFEFNTIFNLDLFDQTTVVRLIEHYKNLIEEVISNPDMPLAKYSVLSAKEQKTIFEDWNANQADYPKDRCIHELFEQQAKMTPNAIGVVYQEEALTYQQLDERISQLAIYLQTQNVRPECLVALCVERSIEMIIGLLGILKAGGAYVPLDPDYPAERLEYMMKDSKVSLILTQSKLMDKMSGMIENAKTIALDNDWEEIASAAQGGKTLKREVRPDNLAYVIYTSGSTGKPKGVMVSHRSISNTLHFLESYYYLTNEDAYLLKTNYTFDVSLAELFGWFIGNGRLIILPPNGEKSPEIIVDVIKKYAVTHINFVPAMLNVFLNEVINNKQFLENCSLKYIMVAGEAFPKELVKKTIVTFRNTRIENIYGPTEAAIYASWFSCSNEKIVSINTPIGKPIANTKLYVVDRNLQITPVGVPGELCIAGEGLARGYLNLPELTAEKFIDNPFSPGTKLYKTGDLVRWLPDGNIEFLGRIDFQVKIRGYRIELGEIESQLVNHPNIQDCVVVVREHESNKQLIAYYTTKRSEQGQGLLTLAELRKYMSARLPDYMVPSFFVHLDKLPLTSSGKVNRGELEKNSNTTIHKRAEIINLPQSAIETKVLEIWKNVLGITDITTEDVFFDIGGDSILAVTVAQKIKSVLNCDFNVTSLFKFPNVKSISKYIAERNNELVSQGGVPEKTESSCMGYKPINTVYEQSYPDYYNNSLAIIGISCHFPGAKNHFEFWQNLKEGKESIKFLSEKELQRFGLPKKTIHNSNFVPVQSTIEGKDYFDPRFFNISPRDAEFMDPQMRLLLVHSWKALEDAGYSPRQIPETGVFMSASNSFYQFLLFNTTKPISITNSADDYVAWILAQGGTIPTMISHKLGLKGPSFFIHSNCSSSLTGLYTAYQSLQAGEIKYALVGSSTIFPASTPGYVHQPGLNFSSNGHIKAFDAAADGMILGEGVAVMLLKRAIDAVEEGDHIYALIRGISANNDGNDKVGFYAPSVKGQAEVIQKVLNATHINPRSISFVEAHGTGTKLGDPIEFTALCDVYQQYTTDKQFCGIGSVKTNIGHLDATAGLAGCIKVALSLYHDEIPPSLNYGTPNPNIDMTNSPFYVINKLRSLEKTAEPHRAALSSFGLGGTNSHAILEQYIESKTTNVRLENDETISYIIPLSAKNEQRLREYVHELAVFLKTYWEQHYQLADLANTFQVGREEMDSRVSFIVRNSNELIQKLEKYEQEESSENCFRGTAKQSEEIIKMFGEEECQAIINKWLLAQNYQKLAELWVKGFRVDWKLLHCNAKPRRISLPTYPFAQERYWPQPGESKSDSSSMPISVIHPLLHRNTSDIRGLKFSSIFTGQEFFLADHVVKEVPILPGMASLEMARAAVEQIIGNYEKGKTTIRFRNVVWPRPITSNQALEVHIGLVLDDNGRISYKIHSGSEDFGKEPLLCSQGNVEPIFEAITSKQDIRALHAQCRDRIINSRQFYDLIAAMGIDYGPGYQGIEEIFLGTDHILAKLSLPAIVADTQGQYILHPSIMDSAVQVTLVPRVSPNNWLEFGSKIPDKVTLPFALEELEVRNQSAPLMWALVRPSINNLTRDVQELDIDLCDDQGVVCVRMKGFTWRVLEKEIKHDSGADTISVETGTGSDSPGEAVMLIPVWDSVSLESNIMPPAIRQEVVIIGGINENIEVIRQVFPNLRLIDTTSADSLEVVIQKLKACGSIEHILWIAPSSSCESLADDALINDQNKGVLHCYRVVKALLQLGYGIKNLNFTVITTQSQPINRNEQVNPTHSSIHGFISTVYNEYSHWQIRLIDLAANSRWPIDDMFNLPAEYQGNTWVYREKKWYQLKLVPFSCSSFNQSLYKKNGVYVVIGGAGGIGEVWSEYMIRNFKAQIIWIGRRKKDNVIQAKLDRLAKLGPVPQYISADATDRNSLQQAYDQIKQGFSQIKGVIHAAILLQDSSLANMDEEKFKRGLSAKVDVCVRIAQVFDKESLDFVLFFSSINSFTKTPGQSNYNAGCIFKDIFAHQLSRAWSCKVKVMNWGYWGNVGVGADKTYRDKRAREGIGAIEPQEAMEALNLLLNGPVDQIAMLKRIKEQVFKEINSKETITVYPESLVSCIHSIQQHISPVSPPIDCYNGLSKI